MLVLSRKVEEGIRIGHDIVITVISAGPGRVQLGITAPRDVRILRAELPDSIVMPADHVEVDGHRRAAV